MLTSVAELASRANETGSAADRCRHPAWSGRGASAVLIVAHRPALAALADRVVELPAAVEVRS